MKTTTTTSGTPWAKAIRTALGFALLAAASFLASSAHAVDEGVPPGRAGGAMATYSFVDGVSMNEAAGTVFDVSGVTPLLNLTIKDKTKTSPVAGPGGGLSLDAKTLLFTPGPATKIIDACKLSDAITVEAFVIRPPGTQAGPARIVSNSSSTSSADRNFMLGEGLYGALPDDVAVARLPLLLDPCGPTRCIDEEKYGPAQSGYWSSSSLASDPVYAWGIDSSPGGLSNAFKTDGGGARAVRGGR